MKLRAAVLSMLLLPTLAFAQAVKPADLVEKVRPALVVVEFTYEGELGRREFAGMGVVLREDGLTMLSMGLTPRGLPDEQMKEFKLIIPGDDEVEIEAEFLGRDERYGISYVKPVKSDKKWQTIQFVDAPMAIGDTAQSVGLLPKGGGYMPYFSAASISAKLRGPLPQILVSGGGLTVVGSPVFNEKGEAIGLVGEQPERLLAVGDRVIPLGDRNALLNDPRNPYASVENPTRLFVPSSDFLPSLKSPPESGKPVQLTFIGVTSLTGLTKDVAEFYGLKGQVAIQVGDVIPGFSADRAGLKKGHIITKINGKPLERGDQPEEAPQIFVRQLSRMSVGDKVTLTVLIDKDTPAKEIEVTLDERPLQANKARRFYAEDLGFTAREVVFEDTYGRKLPKDTKGVVITFIRPQSSAQAAEMQSNDFVQQINQTPVTDIEQFKEAYRTFRKDKPKEAVVLEVLRQGNTQIIRIEPPRE